ncbi:hypothetical protein Tco_0937480 [Tanacetum coccineum]|uniref:Uncharacterized protein n=1 Tax=Tanacetum coccineum TaxID=301880 RepID=A0ABQ5DF44_9ASTR
MDNPNITMEEYIRLQEEKALSWGKTFNWQTTTYGKMEYCEDEDDCFTNFKTKFPAIVLDNTLTSDAAISCGPTVSPLNDNEIDFRISFDESDDEDYTVVYDENSFSYKIIYVNNLKMDSENDNDKVNMPSFTSPEPEVSYFNDLDFFKDSENEFLAIVYNDALTSKSNFLTEPTESPQHIDEFNLKNESSLSECDEKEQNVLYFNDLFPFNVIYPDDLKSDTDNNNKINIERPSGDMSITPIRDVINVNAQGSNMLSRTRPSEQNDNIGGVFINLEISKLKMDNPNITMEKYIRLQEEKALSRAIVLDNTLTSDAALSCGPTVSPLNDNEIDFRISFDEFDDEDYTVVYDENSFSYKIIYVNNLKTDSENDKVNMPSFLSPEPEVSYFNDLDFFKDFENEFPAIVYNDALTSKLDLLTEPTISPRRIDEFDLKDETSLSECDEEEQNILYFNDLFPFNVIYPNDLKSDTENNNKFDIEQPSRDMSITPIPDVINVNAQGYPGEPSEEIDNIVIMESLVKKKQKGAILELKRRHLKNTIFCTYTPYPAMKIRRISASSAQETRNDQFLIRRIHYNQYAVCTAVHQSKIRI